MVIPLLANQDLTPMLSGSEALCCFPETEGQIFLSSLRQHP